MKDDDPPSHLHPSRSRLDCHDGGVAFMIIAVLFILIIVALLGWPSSVYLFHGFRNLPLATSQLVEIYGCFTVATGLSVATWWLSMPRRPCAP